jgi:hypothetical protein
LLAIAIDNPARLSIGELPRERTGPIRTKEILG